MLIFGSTAAKHWYPDFREPKDLDYISKDGKMERLEQHYWFDSFDMLLEMNEDLIYLDPRSLYTVKCAHANWDIHWEKTMHDIAFFQKRGLAIHNELYEALVKSFRKVHGKAWATLKDKSPDEFFGDAVNRIYVHDDIHEAVAYYDRPLYFRIQPDEGKVTCSGDLFDKLSHDDKIKLVKEELFVTALERWLIPQDFKYSQQLAYYKSLRKLITTMGSGWFSKWIILNYSELTINKDKSYIDKFKNAIHNNQIRKEQ